MAAVNKAQIMAAMECPVCYDILRPPIHPCNQGHPICGDCRQQMERLSQNVCCPLCRSGYSLPPSHILEAIYNSLRVSCRFNAGRCRHVCWGKDMKIHEQKCKFGPRTCPKRNQVTKSLAGERVVEYSSEESTSDFDHNYGLSPGLLEIKRKIWENQELQNEKVLLVYNGLSITADKPQVKPWEKRIPEPLVCEVYGYYTKHYRSFKRHCS
ncbi:Putative E3 ubiquitin-protein ligase SINA-like 6 [Tribolium castaneum]|uniref:E3 ubiquitin-protein ligase SINA-like 6 n=1 Tax=Tribolium castaneum TaxID=7070 RepID=A0A139WDN9_TRICA|nr:Putative E3 ubiquitin-protein ligase SINA-like 6 [Tribolium castaneum]